jgi:hypothetical protein
MRALVLCSVVIWLLTAGTAVAEERCNGPYNHQSPGSPEALKKVLATHEAWIKAGRPKADQINLCGIVLAKLDLKGADLRDALLRDADLTGSDVTGAKLERADLTGAVLIGANLQDVDCTDATLMHADLSKANLNKAKLTGAVLIDAIATETIFTDADLRKAVLKGADFTGAYLDTDLDFVVLELKPGRLPNVPSLALAKNLFKLQYAVSPHSLVELREAFRKAGMRREEREVTYAIRHEERMRANALESVFNWFLFELPTAYGMEPGRALMFLAALVGLFAIPYTVMLRPSKSKEGPRPLSSVVIEGERARLYWPVPAGIWAVRLGDGIHKWGDDQPVLLTTEFVFPRARPIDAPHGTAIHWLLACIAGLYFSALSSFQMGWRELNVGTWMTRLQPREYTIRATGWVRTVSGIQSLMSVYLLALWALTYFGRPFE